MKYDVAMTAGCDSTMEFNTKITDLEALKFIKRAGFSKVFLSWKTDGWSAKCEVILNEARKLGLEVVFAHLGYRKSRAVAEIWKEGKIGDEVINGFIEDLRKLKEHNINLAVVHVSKSNENPILSEIGIKRWKKVVKEAEKLDITLALENTVWPGVLEYIFENIKSNKLKICYDSGHDHKYFKDSFDFKYFKDKIVATHIHDNDSQFDHHCLPFDGDINWKEKISQLKKAKYNNTLSCEAVYWNGYRIAKPSKFYKEAYKRLVKLRKELDSE